MDASVPVRRLEPGAFTLWVVVGVVLVTLIAGVAFAGNEEPEPGLVTDPLEQILLIEPYRTQILSELEERAAAGELTPAAAAGLEGEIAFIEERIAKACAQLEVQPPVCAEVAGTG